MSFEELKNQMYDLFTMTMERIQVLYVNPGKYCDVLRAFYRLVHGSVKLRRV